MTLDGEKVSKVAGIAQRASAERGRLTTEVAKLNELVAGSRSVGQETPGQGKVVADNYGSQQLMDLKIAIKSLENKNSEVSHDMCRTVISPSYTSRQLDQVVEEGQNKLARERITVLQLHQALADRSEELGSLKKRLNNDNAVATSLQQPYKSTSDALKGPLLPKHEHAAVREEIMGLKSVCGGVVCPMCSI